MTLRHTPPAEAPAAISFDLHVPIRAALEQSSDLKAWHLNASEIWCGRTAEEAIAAAERDTGEDYDPADVAPVGDEMLDRPYTGEDGTPTCGTLRLELASRTEPGFLAATDW